MTIWRAPPQHLLDGQGVQIHRGDLLQCAAQSTDGGSEAAYHHDILNSKASLLELEKGLL